MAGAIALHFLFGQFRSGLCDGQLQVALLCFFHPFFHAGQLSPLQLELRAQRAQFTRCGIGELL